MKKASGPSPILFPLPIVLVTMRSPEGVDNIITVTWSGMVNSDPPMLSISVRKTRYSHKMLEDSGEFVINLPGANILREVEQCGILSGKEADKFAVCGFKKMPAAKVNPPLIDRCPVNIECMIRNKLSLPSHDLFVGEIVAVHVDDAVLDSRGKIDLTKMKPMAFAFNEYVLLGQRLSKMGFMIKK